MYPGAPELDAGPVLHLESDAAVHAETTVTPAAHLLDQLRVHLAFVQQQLEDALLPRPKEGLVVDLGQTDEAPVARRR